MDSIEDIKKEREMFRLLYENANSSLVYWEEKCRRLETKNKRLEKELKDYKTSKENSYQNLQKEWQQLQWDIRNLTTENERLKKLKFKSDGIELLQDANLNLHNANIKYRQALQEIRDIADIIYNANCHPAKEAQKIIDKINEVIGGDNE